MATAGRAAGIRQAPFHIEGSGHRLERRAKGRLIQREILQVPLHAHEEQPEIVVLVLIGVKNVGAVAGQETGNARDDSLAVRAMNQKNGGIWHCFYSLM